eukprot:1138629-Pelagomonas_calceolata.AAC.9
MEDVRGGPSMASSDPVRGRMCALGVLGPPDSKASADPDRDKALGPAAGAWDAAAAAAAAAGTAGADSAEPARACEGRGAAQVWHCRGQCATQAGCCKGKGEGAAQTAGDNTQDKQGTARRRCCMSTALQREKCSTNNRKEGSTSKVLQREGCSTSMALQVRMRNTGRVLQRRGAAQVALQGTMRNTRVLCRTMCWKSVILQRERVQHKPGTAGKDVQRRQGTSGDEVQTKLLSDPLSPQFSGTLTGQEMLTACGTCCNSRQPMQLKPRLRNTRPWERKGRHLRTKGEGEAGIPGTLDGEPGDDAGEASPLISSVRGWLGGRGGRGGRPTCGYKGRKSLVRLHTSKKEVVD